MAPIDVGGPAEDDSDRAPEGGQRGEERGEPRRTTRIDTPTSVHLGDWQPVADSSDDSIIRIR